MRVVINAQLDFRTSGGIAQVLIGLASGLGRLPGSDEYMFVCSPASAEWLRPYLGANSVITVNERHSPGPRRGVHTSDGFWESFSPDVLHFPYQTYTRTGIPTVFNPHDLQHVHLPDHFNKKERERRDSLLRDACGDAVAIAVASEWVRSDLATQYGIDPAKIHVIEWAAPTSAYQRPDDKTVGAILESFELSPGFVIYPAQTWPHKNHERLLAALVRVRDRRGWHIPLVCTGALTEHADRLRFAAEKMKLGSLVRWLGRVDELELLALYRAARLMVVPTLFEAASFPIYEAFAEGLPVACSNATSLPEQVGDAAIVFDPFDIDAMADAIERLYCDDALRMNLAKRGKSRVARLSWESTADAYRQLYRTVAKRRDGRCSVVVGRSVQGRFLESFQPTPLNKQQLQPAKEAAE
jgi:glycosyltransferase involved in cell wall biosynthesis